MGRHRRGGDKIYKFDVKRMSVYPSPNPRRSMEREKPPRVGEEIEVRIVGIDEDGRGIGRYRGYEVIVDEAEPGTTLRVVVSRVAGRRIHARTVERP